MIPPKLKPGNFAWTKKPSLLRCACGQLAYRKKHGEPVCERCDIIEHGARRAYVLTQTTKR